MSLRTACISWLFCLSQGLAAVSSPPERQILDGKLRSQWQKYEDARALALNHPVERAEWEKALAVTPDFTESELKALREWQDGLVGQQKARNEKDSVISLEALRKGAPERIKQFCADLPKGGQLHVHDWGTMSENGMADLLTRINPLIRPLELHDEFKPGARSTTALNRGTATLYPTELAFLDGLAKKYGKEFRYTSLKLIDQAKLRDLFFLTHGSHPFSRFEAVFMLFARLVFDKPTVDVNRLLWDDYFSRAQTENVSYVEISEPVDITAAAMTALDARSQDIQSRFGIVTRTDRAFFRAWPPEDLGKDAQKLLALAPANTLVGINLVNNEKDAPALEKGQPIFIPFLRATEAGKTRLHRTMHAGELGEPHNVRDALILGAERIGHGVLLNNDPVTLEYARLHQIPIESELTSNVRLGVVKDYAHHPFLRFLRLGLRVSLSTDDEGIFGTDINRECVHAIAETDMNYAELRQMLRNSIDTSFANDDDRTALAQKLNGQLTAFETRWKSLTH